MTRINVVPPQELCDKHLLAEYRELPRVFGLARSCPDAPKEYTLGKGHVKFFYDKLWFLVYRFDDIVRECLKRGFNIQYQEFNRNYLSLIPKPLWKNYTPTPEALALNRARIAERLAQMAAKKAPAKRMTGASR